MNSSNLELAQFEALPIKTNVDGLHSRKNSNPASLNDFSESLLTDQTINANSEFRDKADCSNHVKVSNSNFDEVLAENDAPTLVVEKVPYKGEYVLVYPLTYRLPLVKFQLFALFVIFTTIGLNDQATGNLLPILEKEYNVSQVFVSNIFLMQTLGYMSSCMITEKVHLKYGQFGALMMGGLLVVTPSIILFSKVRWFILYVMCYYPIGIGIGLIDSIVNLVFGSLLENRSELLAVVHGVYGCCSFLTPLIISKLGPKYWNYFFLCQLTFSGSGLIACFFAFKNETKLKYEYMLMKNEEKENNSPDNYESSKSTLSLVRKYPIISLYTIALFFHLGTEVGFGSWIYYYLLNYKDGPAQQMAYITSSFWFGLTLGRFAFGVFLSKWFPNEYQALRFFSKSTFLFCCMLTIFAALKAASGLYFLVFASLVFSLGVFIGPIFPLSSVVAVELLKPSIRLRGISIAISIGSVGVAMIPYCDGIIMKFLGFGLFPMLVTICALLFTGAIFLYPKYVQNRTSYFYPN